MAAFCAQHVIQTKGRFAGQPLVFEDWEREFVDELYRVEGGQRVYQNATLLLPRKNGKTTLASGIGLYELVADGEESPEVYVAAGARDQATVLHNQAKSTVHRSPSLSSVLDPQQYIIKHEASNGIFKVLASDARLQHGSNPSCALIDEKWTHKNNDLAAALETGTGARVDPLTLTISTVGHDMESALGEDFVRGMKLPRESRRDGFLTIGRDEAAGYLFWYFGPPHDEAGNALVDLEDPAVWRMCNPASWITDEYLAKQRKKQRIEDFRRFHLNAWVESEELWLPVGAWGACSDPTHFPVAKYTAHPAWVGVDIGQKRDRAAVVVLVDIDSPDAEGRPRYAVEATIWDPPDDGTSLDIAVVREHVRELMDHFDIQEVVYDPWRFEESAQMLADDGVPMLEHPMSNERTCPESHQLWDAIVNGRILHNDDTLLSRHVLAGATTSTDRGWKISRRKATKPIDALIALLLAYSSAEDGESSRSVYEGRGIKTI